MMHEGRPPRRVLACLVGQVSSFSVHASCCKSKKRSCHCRNPGIEGTRLPTRRRVPAVTYSAGGKTGRPKDRIDTAKRREVSPGRGGWANALCYIVSRRNRPSSACRQA
ncbi:hypothetical protein OH77DRAFT_343594 [Trametes cingulata]|nr:hypothetical protein OH77DRAFT_343594 [Trametes cingulata]